MGVLGKANIGGVLRDLTGEGYVNIGGVLRPISMGNFNIGGVLLAGGYTWKKYTVKEVSVLPYQAVRPSTTSNITMIDTILRTLSSSYNFNSTTGLFTSSGSVTSMQTTEGWTSSLKYYIPNSGSSNYMYEYVSKKKSSNGYVCTVYEWTAKMSISYEMGTYIEDVISDNETAYPENGRHTDGYWYVKQ